MEQIGNIRMAERLEQISDLLYQDRVREAYRELAAVLPELEQVIIAIESDSERNLLRDKLSEVLQAMEEEDTVLMADLLRYEVAERLRDAGEGEEGDDNL